MDVTPQRIDELLEAWAIEESPAVHPPSDLRAELLAEAARTPRPDLPSSKPVDAFETQVDALFALLANLDADEWGQPAAPYAWTVHGLVAHLAVIERYMAGQLGLAPPYEHGPTTDPDVGHLDIGADEIVGHLAGPPPATTDTWYQSATATIRAVRAGSTPAPDAIVDLHGWPFTTAGLLLARSFEVWTHADDIRRAAGRTLATPSAADLRAMSTFSVHSLPLVWPLVAPDHGFGGARVVLTGDGGGTFDLGTGRDTLVVADVVDYCRLAARRIAPADLEVVVEGDRPTADRLLAAARVFAV